MFSNNGINFSLLQNRAFNLRWADVPKGVIPLTAADPDFPCAPEIAEAICKYTKDRYFSYAPIDGYSFFKESMAQYYLSERNIIANPKYIFPVDSAAFAIATVCKAFLQKGDEAIIFDPVDFLFRYNIENNHATAVPLRMPIDPKAEFDCEKLEHLITAKTKLICLCNPLNPSGKVFNKKELEQIGALAVKYGIIILSDEIWSDIIFKPNRYISIASLNQEIANQTIVVHGFSKSYGLAGLRIGSIMASNQLHYQLLLDASLHQFTVHGSNVLAQVAATAALNECSYWLKGFMAHLELMKTYCVNEFNSIEGFSCFEPQGCYLAFINIQETGFSSEALHQLLLEKANVAVVPGLAKWFGRGSEGYIRISFATSEEVLKEACNRIKNTMGSLR